MIHLLKKFNTLSVGILALSFIMAVSLGACSTSEYSDDANDTEEAVTPEATEASEETAEGDHPEGEEHPSDSTAKDGDHPEGEHPESDDAEEEAQ